MRSIFLGYYIGSLLLWKGKPATFEALACEPVYGYAGGQSNPEHIVLDGQQCLTAMFESLWRTSVAGSSALSRSFATPDLRGLPHEQSRSMDGSHLIL